MVELSVIPDQFQVKMTRLLAEVASLKESFDDFTLTKDDLDAIEEGERDLMRGRTRRL